jgi:Na+-transporting NADH:ubiquinone oxidoreductase subunit NqrC
MGEHNESQGIGTNVEDPGYLAQFFGHNDPHSVDSVSGATRTSSALKTVLELSNQVFEAVREEAVE